MEIVKGEKSDPASKERLRTIHTKFRLIHVMSQCALFSHSVKLPEWGFDQQEVTCIKGGKIPKTIWYIESTENSLCKCSCERFRDCLCTKNLKRAPHL